LSALLLDSHVWLAAHDADDPYHEAARALLGGDGELAALDLTLYEVANVCAVRWRDVELAERLTAAVEIAVGARLLRADAGLMSAASRLAAEHNLSVYDAACAAGAELQGWRLISGDRDLLAPGLASAPAEVAGPEST
jgi:predicted nucleic acid-binding protein